VHLFWSRFACSWLEGQHGFQPALTSHLWLLCVHCLRQAGVGAAKLEVGLPPAQYLWLARILCRGHCSIAARSAVREAWCGRWVPDVFHAHGVCARGSFVDLIEVGQVLLHHCYAQCLQGLGWRFYCYCCTLALRC
jgi:hypothetical protein